MAAAPTAVAAYAAPLTDPGKGRSTEESRSKKKMAKRKQTKKQREASLKNQAKARRAARGSGRALAKARHGGKKPLTKAQKKKAAKRRASLRHLGAGRAMATRGKRRLQKPPSPPRAVRGRARPKRARMAGRSPAHRTQKQHAAALRNLAKARSARKSARKRHKVKGYSYHVKPKRVSVPAHMSWEARRRRGRKRHQTAAQRRASLANLRKARAARRRGKGRAREARRYGYEAYEASRRKKGRRGQTAAQHRAALKNLKKARAARKRATSRHPVKGYSYHRKPARRHVPAHLSWESVYQNPLSGVELFVGGFSGLVWFGATDFVDRLVATHDLTDRGATDAAGHALYADTPPTSGDYAGLYNATAITAPMNAWRWLAGVGMSAAPFGLAWVIGPEHTAWKAAFQGAGFGGVMRIGGKALIDLVSLISMWTKLGERLYDGEMRAQILSSSDQTPLSSLPYASSPTTPGVAGAPKPCGECTQCKSGVGACVEVGVGWPSMPRENMPTSSATPPSPPPPPPTTPTTPATTPVTTQTIQGVARPPALPEPARRMSPFAWGAKEEDREAA